MHNIYYIGLSGERSLPFGLLVLENTDRDSINLTKIYACSEQLLQRNVVNMHEFCLRSFKIYIMYIDVVVYQLKNDLIVNFHSFYYFVLLVHIMVK